MDLTVTTMLDSDIIPISRIQFDNLRENLTPEQRVDGYLSIAFSETEFRDFNRDLGVVVAKVQGEVAGYCCVSSASFNAQFPILDQIVADLPSYSITGTDLRATEATTCFYGPACIAKPFRGGKALERLFSYAVKLSKAAGYSFCFSFISAENKRSLKAHLKLPFHRVGTVSYNDNAYVVVACTIGP